MNFIESGLAVGAIVVLLCTSSAGGRFREWMDRWEVFGQLPYCHFCMSCWVSMLFMPEYSITDWAATVALANITVLLIHMSMSTVENEDVQVVD